MKIRKVPDRKIKTSRHEERFIIGFDEFCEYNLEFAGAKLILEHEPITFRLPNLRYTPDFLVTLANEELAVIEIKGSRYQRDYYYSRARMIAISHALPLFYFVIIELGRVKNKPKDWVVKWLDANVAIRNTIEL